MWLEHSVYHTVVLWATRTPVAVYPTKLSSCASCPLPVCPTPEWPTVSCHVLFLASLLGILSCFIFIAITDQLAWPFPSILQTIHSQHADCWAWVFSSLLPLVPRGCCFFAKAFLCLFFSRLFWIWGFLNAWRCQKGSFQVVVALFLYFTIYSYLKWKYYLGRRILVWKVHIDPTLNSQLSLSHKDTRHLENDSFLSALLHAYHQHQTNVSSEMFW